MKLTIAKLAVLPLAIAVGSAQAASMADKLSDTMNSKAQGGKLGTTLSALNKASKTVSLSSNSNSMKKMADLSGSLMVNDRVTVDLAVKGDIQTMKAELAAMGATNISFFGNMASAQIPVANLDAAAANSKIQFIRPTMAKTNVGVVTSQADQAFRSDIARQALGVDGTGIRIGVLSDSVGCNPASSVPGAPTSTLAEGIANGDLSSDLIILDDTACPASDEGRAMLELIYDVAPGSALAFHTAFGGQAGFASGIVELATDAGSDVIVDDVIFFAEPMFQDGIIAQATDTVRAMGVPYFSSAGNNARASYEDDFRPVDIGGGLTAQDFDAGPGVDIFQDIIVLTDATGFGQTIPSFQWDAPNLSVSGAPGSPSDLDLLFFDQDGNLVLDCFNDFDPVAFPETGGFPLICQFGSSNNTGGDAIELPSIVSFIGQVTVQAAIIQFEGPAPTRVKYVPFGRTGDIIIAEFDTQSSTTYGHSNAAGAIAVGAAPFSTTAAFNDRDFGGECLPACAEPFSSAGGLEIRFDIQGNRIAPLNRFKPEISGPDGANTSFFASDSIIDDDDGDGLLSPFFDGENPADEFPNFFGTSASAPHVAAIAALMLDASEERRLRVNDGTRTRICDDGDTLLVPDVAAQNKLRDDDDGEVYLGFCLTVDDILSTMQETALDMRRRVISRFAGTFEEIPNSEGFDFDTGSGFVDGLAAISAVAVNDDDDD